MKRRLVLGLVLILMSVLTSCVPIWPVGDFNHDCVVDICDIAMIGARTNTAVGDPGYQLRFDVDQDWEIDAVDIQIVCGHYGQTCRWTPVR